MHWKESQANNHFTPPYKLNSFAGRDLHSLWKYVETLLLSRGRESYVQTDKRQRFPRILLH